MGCCMLFVVTQVVSFVTHLNDLRGRQLRCVVLLKRGFYEKVTDVNISSLFFLRWRLCFSFQLRRMLFSTLFLYALCMGLRLCAGWGPMEKSMLQFSVGLVERPPRAQSSERGIVATFTVISLSQTVAA
jgi:hypothetical protein